MSGTILIVFVNFLVCKAGYATEFPPDKFGTSWVAFLHADGRPFYVNLTYTDDEIDDFEKSTSVIGPGGNTRFFLYTKDIQNRYEELNLPEKHSSFLDTNVPVFILVHGWLFNLDSEFPQSVKTAIVNHDWGSNINVIIMDWHDMQSYNYVTTAKRTKEAGKILRNFVSELTKKYDISGSMIHIVGHSLGAHVAGRAGIQLKKLNIHVFRITGLDPARPYFEYPATFPGLSSDAARFVDIIHTSADQVGVSKPMGHADFYPNGGKSQPACCKNKLNKLPGACEHNCAYKYYEKSFDKIFNGFKCKDYTKFSAGLCKDNEKQYMGEPCFPSASGLYFLEIDNF